MFRSGKADLIQSWLSGLTWDDIKTLKKSNPEIQVAEFPNSNPKAVYGRIDRKPFDDVRVRQALSMAINRENMAKNLFGGHCATFNFPVLNIPEFKNMYRPLSDYPKHIREIYEYHPEKAKKLLAEAGYPKGFKTKMVCQQDEADYLSIVKEDWAKIGVEMEIDIKENAVYNSIIKAKKHEQMIAGWWHPTAYFKFTRLMPGMTWNYAVVDDPKIKEAEAAMAANYFDLPKREKIFMDMCPYVLEQCYGIEVPNTNSFSLWQPWVKGYHGETEIGYSNCLGNYTWFIWKDRK
jgi:peptide/nickel transport system substrate-binding protein